MGGFTDINLEIDDGNINLNQKIIKGKIKSVSAIFIVSTQTVNC